ncbi:TPA: hypothetical protein RG728_002305 [Morganella morganii subsp. morganii]|uniref:Uncharacterized protein n=1 Tax=Morganella morganii TaxID=582 RepID=A0AAU8ZPI4_MORMO|nr:hypothetical protein [Morganella morganii]HDU8693190.1 hypothetical protein [Morganella morganii subsp. morganii]AWC94621.1 hypothetical protein AM380_13770 [Morganella morganii]EKW8485120.1 hypothetical protein [Morganella morganii]HAT3623571.1 hypothetical protein [Morganella morganii]HCU0878194.1 hypothetical protein [Morganella morganii]
MKLKMIAAATLLFSAAGLAAPSLADKTTFVADCTKGAVTNLKNPENRSKVPAVCECVYNNSLAKFGKDGLEKLDDRVRKGQALTEQDSQAIGEIAQSCTTKIIGVQPQ